MAPVDKPLPPGPIIGAATATEPEVVVSGQVLLQTVMFLVSCVP